MKMRLSLGNVPTRALKAGGAVLAVGAVGGYPVQTLAAPYASNVQITGTSVSFTLNESADLLFHYLVLLNAKGRNLQDVIDILKQRHSK